MNYEVILLQDALDFLNSLEIKLKAKAFRSISLLKLFGSNLREPHSKALADSDGLFELRVKVGSNIVRIFYFHSKGKVFVVTSGYVKKTIKTEKNELLKAKKLMKQFKEG